MDIKFIPASLILCILPALCSGQKVNSFNQSGTEVNVKLTDGTLCIFPVADNAVRIRFFKETQPKDTELIFIRASQNPVFKVSDSRSALIVKGEKITVSVDKKTGPLSFSDNAGNIFLKEKENTRGLIPGAKQGEPRFTAEQSFESPDDEHLFGLGQFQDGFYNIRNITRRLIQVNSQISIPFIYSNKGYGLLWHQYGLTDFNPADNHIALEKQVLITGNNQTADVTTTSGTQRRSQNQSVYNGTFEVPYDGIYSVFVDYGDMESHHYVVIDDSTCIDQSNTWLPSAVSTHINLTAGDHRIRLTSKTTNNPKVSWKKIDNLTTFRSPDAKLLDYIVFYGPSADDVIAAYRNLSGNAPLLPLWAYGFWQCRERYSSGAQLVETVKEFRKRNLPMDVIVQDWQYWGKNGWGVPQFDESNYPDPAGFIKELHDLNAHLNISIWSNPDRNSVTGKKYVSDNLYIQDTKWLDYFNPTTRKEYWNTLKENLFDYGVDSWWMDATEPENDALKGVQTYIGDGDFYRLTYPLLVSQAVYEGQRKTSQEKRVCILTRSAFSGQQRYGAINWSGDVGSTWDAYRRQIVAGLNYSLTGLPYWTTDIGGFFRPGRSQYTDEKYHELLTRWFQWGTFNPVFRIHGFQSETEPWKYGQQVEDNIHKMLNLRYRLIPYIYSEAYQITKNGSTMMRPLAMDFRDDITALDKPYEYMFGRAFLVAPVTQPDIREWTVYLPGNSGWFDFWTGSQYDGGHTVTISAPLNRIPLFVKAGSIVPMGKFIQYTGEKPADTLEVRIYKGEDGRFSLYEDENDNYNYEKGICSTIDFSWNNASGTLIIGKRNGEFPGMLKTRVFRLVLVAPENGTGMDLSQKYGKEVTYNGQELRVDLLADPSAAPVAGKVQTAHNPVIFADVPDVSMIRAGDTYYMSSTTMHMSPGVPVMKSKDLINWKIVSYAYDTLGNNDALNLNNGKNAYGRGSWASCIRFHNGTYYISTFSATTGKTYIFSSKDPDRGPWKRISFSPSFHDNTLFFDDDGRIYLITGNKRLTLVELKSDLTGVKPGGINEVIIENASLPSGNDSGLGEGSQLFKVNGKYFLFNITWPKGGMRTVVIHRADKITGPWEGRLAFQDKGVAQGGMIDTPDGRWFAYLFRDYGSVGRIPYLVPMKWEDGWPVIGVDGKVPDDLDLPAGKGLIPGIVASDEFSRKKGDRALPLVWQWNHNPVNNLWSVTRRKGYLRLTTGRIDTTFVEARNTLTQRTIGPECSGSACIDVSGMKEGDFAGLALLQRKYGIVGVRYANGSRSVVMVNAQSGRPVEAMSIPLDQKVAYLKAECDFTDRRDVAYFYYSLDGKTWKKIGNQLKMEYSMPHFMGYRFGLFNYASKTPGGYVDFDWFRIVNKRTEID